MDKLLIQAQVAIAKIENCQLVTGELIRLGISIGKGNKITAVVESNAGYKNRLQKVEVKMADGTSYYFC
jgi:hypothetical protein